MGEMFEIVATLVLAMLGTGVICSRFAKANGQNPTKWFVIGFVFNLFALAFLFFMQIGKKPAHFSKLVGK